MAWADIYEATLESWVVDGSLASISQVSTINLPRDGSWFRQVMGWAIDRCGTIPAAPSDVVDHILLYYDLAAWAHATIYRLNYYVNFTARLSQYQPNI